MLATPRQRSGAGRKPPAPSAHHPQRHSPRVSKRGDSGQPYPPRVSSPPGRLPYARNSKLETPNPYGNANTANKPMWSLAYNSVSSTRFTAASPMAPVSAGHHPAESR